MVFSPLILFIFLLLALVIVVWFYKYFNKTPVIEIQEPLVAFESRMKAGATIPSANELPPYSGNLPNKKIAKIYDNIFYDIDNGNLIEVDSPGIGKTGSISTSTPTPTTTTTPTPTPTPTTPTPTQTNRVNIVKNDISLDPADADPAYEDPAYADPSDADPIEPFTQEGLTTQTQTPNNNNNKKVDIKRIWISRRQDAGTPVIEYSEDPDKYDPKGTPESRLELVNSYNHFVYKTRSGNTNRYTVLYVAWLDGTFITMINLDTNELVTTQLFSSVGTTSNTLLYNQSSLNPLTLKSRITLDNSPTNNKYILLNKYDGQVHIFQLSSNIYFDPRNAQLIVLNQNSIADNITVFSRIGTIIPNGYLNNTEYDATSVFNSWTYYDESGNKMVLYISFDEITLIILLESDSNTGYRIYNVQRFDKNGVDTGTNTEITRPTSTAPKSTEPKVDGNVVHDGNNRSCSVRYWSNPDGKFMNKTGSGSECDTLINHNNKPSNNNNDMDPISMPNSTNMMNDYYQWYYNWVKNGKKDLPSRNHMYSEDYMLKTQIVPPVCPACSTSLGTCVNCSSGNSFTGGDSMFYNPWLNIYSKDKNIPTFTTGGNAIANKNNIHEDDCDLCSECSEENTQANVITNTNTISPFKYNYRKQEDYNRQDFEEEGDFEEEEGDFGQKNGGYDRLPNGGDFMGEEGDFMEEEGDFMEEEGDFGDPTSNKVMDPYSYFNSVPSKGSNFVPILSDFSKFGR